MHHKNGLNNNIMDHLFDFILKIGGSKVRGSVWVGFGPTQNSNHIRYSDLGEVK